MKMLRRVPIFGIVATPDVPARFAQTQMNPIVAHFQTFFTAIGRFRFGRFYFF
jgi:hypothetical protein